MAPLFPSHSQMPFQYLYAWQYLEFEIGNSVKMVEQLTTQDQHLLS